MKSKDLIDKLGRLSATIFFLIQIIRILKSPILYKYSFLIGIAPNIVGVVFLMTFLRRNLNKFFLNKFNNTNFYILLYFLSIIILVGWEYFRHLIAGYSFDTDDILASIITGLVFLIFIIFYKKSTHNNNESN